jgi:multicomponent Na+:H+ antiporter subunit F
MNAVIYIVSAVLGAAGILAVAVLIRSRKTSRKAVVLDVFTTLIAAALLVLAWASDSAFLLDIAVVYAVLSFAAVLLVGRYLERSI